MLEEEVQAERELSNSIVLATWEAMEATEGAVAELGTLPPPRHHNPVETHITLGRIRRTGEVCLLVAHAYGDHCAKVA